MALQFTTTGAVAVTLSNGNKTATSTAASGFGAGAYLNETVAGKCCFAMQFGGPADGGNIVELIAAATGLDFANYSIVGTYISEFTNASLANSNGSPTGATLSGAAPIVNSDVIFVCIDEPNNLIWVYKNGTIVSGAGDPAAGTGGQSGFLIAGARTPGAALSSTGGAMTVIDDPVTAGITVPSGFTYLGASITDPPSNTVAPSVSPSTSVIVGSNLSCSTGTWTNSPSSYAYQWYRGNASLLGSAIPSATSSSYTAVSGDAGYVLRCLVTATNVIGTSSPVQSNATNAVATRILVTTTGAYSRALNSTDLPLGTGKVTKVETWGSGGSGPRRGRGSGGGAYAMSTNTGTGWNVTTSSTLYGDVPAAVVGTTATSGTNGTSGWARADGTNSAPTLLSQGALAAGGTAGTSTKNGAGGTVAASIGNTRYAGGNGGNTGSGTTLRGAGGGGAGSAGAGGNASAATQGAAGSGAGTAGLAGGLGGASSTGTSVAAAAAPAAGGGAISGASGNGGTSGRGQIAFYIVPDVAVVNTSRRIVVIT